MRPSRLPAIQTVVHMSEQKYQGWSNYETRCVNLWLTNDEVSYSEARKIIATADTENDAAAELREFVKFMEASNPSGLVEDLAFAALQGVSFLEIVRDFSGDFDRKSCEVCGYSGAGFHTCPESAYFFYWRCSLLRRTTTALTATPLRCLSDFRLRPAEFNAEARSCSRRSARISARSFKMLAMLAPAAHRRWPRLPPRERSIGGDVTSMSVEPH